MATTLYITLIREKGKLGAHKRKNGKGRHTHLGSNSTSAARPRERTHERIETKRCFGWAHFPTSDFGHSGGVKPSEPLKNYITDRLKKHVCHCVLEFSTSSNPSKTAALHGCRLGCRACASLSACAAATDSGLAGAASAAPFNTGD